MRSSSPSNSAPHHTVVADGGQVDAVNDLTDGSGAEVVLDFVAEQGAEQDGFAMTGAGGSYYVIGYGAAVNIPTLDIISTERNIVGNIVGTYNELAELMVLAQTGKVTLHTKTYPLDAARRGDRRSRCRPGPRTRHSRPLAAVEPPRAPTHQEDTMAKDSFRLRSRSACCWPASTSSPKRSNRRSGPRAATSSWRRSPGRPWSPTTA